MHVRLSALALTLALTLPANAADWREFRGPDGTGHYAGPPLVTEWGVDKNVTWKTSVPGKGWSSPVLVGGKLVLTTAVPLGEGEKADQSLKALALDAASGKQLWDAELFVEAGATAPPPHKKNSHASPTPVTDGTHVWVHFGHEGTACLDLAGKVVWKEKFGYKPVHGNGGSPILVDDLLVFSVDGNDQQYVVALDKLTGKPRWKTDRKTSAQMKFTFSTPQLVVANGRRLIVSPSSDFVAAYDVSDGKEVWRAKYPKPGWSVITRPVVAAGLVVVQTGYVNQHLMAIDPAGSGDVTATHVKWQEKKNAPNTPTPLAVGDELYVMSDYGTLSCLDAKTGKVHWAERLRGNGFSASPILANGLIYVTSEDGVGQVVKVGKTFEPVSKSELGEKTFASFVPADGALFVRTETQVYRFDVKK